MTTQRAWSLFLSFILILTVMPRPANAGQAAVPAIRVLRSDETLLEVLIAPQGEDSPTSALVAIPWYGMPRVEIVRIKEHLIPGFQAKVQDAFPRRAVTLDDLGYLRGLRLARLSVAPVYGSTRTGFRRVDEVRVRLHFPPARPARLGEPLPDDVQRTVARAVLNSAIPRAWLRPRALAQPVPPSDNPPAHRASALRVTVSKPGIHVIKREDLVAAGWQVEDIDPRYIHLWLNGREMPMWVTGQGDGRFDEGDELRFYVPPFRSVYASEQVWWLTVEETLGLRWKAQPTGVPEPPFVEEVWFEKVTEFDRVYDSAAVDARGEHWFWYDLRFLDFPPFPALDFPFWAPAPAPNPQATVTLSLYAYKGAQHDMTFALNGDPVGEVHDNWQGARDLVFSLANSLQDGLNTLTIQGTDRGASPDGVYVDRISVRYRRLLRAEDGIITFEGLPGEHTYRVSGLPPWYVAVVDVTDPFSPTLIYGTPQYEEVVGDDHRVVFRANGGPGVKYHVQSQVTWQRPRVEQEIPSSWRNPQKGADVIVIAPRVWHDALVPWVEWREEQGYTVAVVALQDIYDEFSYGQPDPEAIRRFLRHAYATWPEPAPRYVLLVGDGSYDFKNNLGYQPDNVLPPYLANVDPWLGETASDIRYVSISGDDLIPDLFVGRWPVGNREELLTVLQKTLVYERDMPTAEWQRHIVFITDNYRDARGRPDSGGNFPGQAEESASGQIHRPFFVDRAYYAPWPEDQQGEGYISSVDDMRARIRLLWNRGAGIINWLGHSSTEQWGEENFLHARQLSWLQNGNRLPFLFSITCFTGYFHHPEYPSLDEVLLTKSDGGIVASWSPTGLAVAYGHQYLQAGFYDALGDGERRVGPLTLAGHLRILSKAEPYAFLPQTFVVLGDPLLSLRLGPTDHVQFLPVGLSD